MQQRVLHLVLYNEAVDYECAMRHISSRLYMGYSRWVHTVYYTCAREGSASSAISAASSLASDEDGQVLRLDGDESLVPGVLTKTVKALQIFDPAEYCCLVRSNISTLLDFATLLQCLPGPFAWGGAHVFDLQWFGCGVTSREHFGTLVASGTNILLGSAVWRFLREHAELLDLSLVDDVSIAVLLNRRWGAPVNLGQMCWVQSDDQPAHWQTTAYRHKSDPDRQVDVRRMAQRALSLSRWHSLLERCLPHDVAVPWLARRCWSKLVPPLATGDCSLLVFNVRYGSKQDVTEQVAARCSSRGWSVDPTDNALLDRLFGDPSPGVLKFLCVRGDVRGAEDDAVDGFVELRLPRVTFFLQNAQLRLSLA